MRIIENKSRWSTDSLRAVLRACASHYEVSLRGMAVSFSTARGPESGFSWSKNKGDGRPIAVFFRLPRPEHFSLIDRIGALDSHVEGAMAAPGFNLDLAHTVEYFIRVTVRGEARTKVTKHGLLPTWWGTMEVAVAQKEKKSRLIGVELQTTKIAAAKERLVTWEKRLKRAQTKVKKITREIRRREKVLAEVGPKDYRRYGPS